MSLRFIQKYKPYLIICLFYFISYWIVLINNDLFWDGWCVYNQNPKDLLIFGRGVGGFLNWPSYFHNFLFDLFSKNAILIERFIIFISYLVSGVFLYKILKFCQDISKDDKLLIVLFFLIFPNNFARISISTIQYSISFLAFYSAFYFFIYYVKTRNKILRPISLVLFFFSFSLNSLLVFYLVPLFMAFYLENGKRFSMKICFKFLISYVDFIILPILFFLIKSIYFAPSGLYAGTYNLISFRKIAASPFKIFELLQKTLIMPIQAALDLGIKHIVYTILGSLIVSLFISKKKDKINFKSSFIFILIGLVFMYLGAFAYMAVGKGPSFGLWNDRYSMLMTLGIAFVFVNLIKIVVTYLDLNNKIYYLIIAFFLMLFSWYNWDMYSKLYMESVKNKALIYYFANSEDIKNNNTFVITDKSENYISKDKGFYEYSGMLKRAFPKADKLAFRSTEPMNLEYYQQFADYSHYNFGNYDFGFSLKNVKLVNIEIYDNKKYTFKKLSYTDYFDKKEFERMLTNMLKVVKS